MKTTDALGQYLAAHPWHHASTEHWPVQGEMRVRLCLAGTLPPPPFISSILAIVGNPHAQLLYLWPAEASGSIAHLLIGGRSKRDETPAETVTREVGEETGWRVVPGRMIGFRHFFHLEPRTEQSDRPYPDFIQPIFTATALRFDHSLLVHGDQIAAEFVAIATVEQRTRAAQRPLIRAAVNELKFD